MVTKPYIEHKSDLYVVLSVTPLINARALVKASSAPNSLVKSEAVSLNISKTVGLTVFKDLIMSDD